MELYKLKYLLGIPETNASQDIVLQFAMQDAEETILNYCHLKELPAGLTNTAYRMAVDLYRYERPGQTEAPATVASISEGDTSTSFAAASPQDSVLKNYRAQLNRYRKLAKG